MALDRDMIVRTALDLLDEVGLEALTLRRLAGRLGVQASALYYHFADKQELLDGMAAAMVGPMPSSDVALPGPEGWRELLRAIGRAMREAMLSRRDGVRLMLSARPDPAHLDFLQALLAVLVDAGFTHREGALAFFTISNYVQGAAIEAQLEEDRRRRETATSDQGARAMRAGPGGDELFGDGLELILEALASRLDAPGRPAGVGPPAAPGTRRPARQTSP